MAEARFAAGCFWGVESDFRDMPGVMDVEVGYTGGTTDNPTYKEVCTGRTGHAEAVRVTYDENVTSFDTLLDAFFGMHDPTQKDRQGPDVGTQYRSAIFPLNQEQREKAEKKLLELSRSGRFSRPVATTIEPAAPFHRAEEYHQRYFEKQGLRACRV